MWSMNDALALQNGAAPRRSAADRSRAHQDRPAQRHPRTLLSVPLKLQYLGPHGIRTTHGISLDVAEGGMGALLQHNLGVGETVGIEFELQGHSLSAVAIVRHCSSARSGFEFVGLPVEERALLASLTAQA